MTEIGSRFAPPGKLPLLPVAVVRRTSTATAVILIFDVWNPFLEAGERERINAMLAARNAFYAG